MFYENGIVRFDFYLKVKQSAVRTIRDWSYGEKILSQPSYSPDLTPYDIFLFPKSKSMLKRQHFDTVDDMKSNSLKAYSKRNFPKLLCENTVKCLNRGG